MMGSKETTIETNEASAAVEAFASPPRPPAEPLPARWLACLPASTPAPLPGEPPRLVWQHTRACTVWRQPLACSRGRTPAPFDQRVARARGDTHTHACTIWLHIILALLARTLSDE